MSTQAERRERKVDINKLSKEQLEQLEVKIGQELARIYDEANEKANKLLNIYGLEAVLQYKIAEKGTLKEDIKQ